VAGRLHAHTGLLDWRRPDDLAIATLDAVGLGSRGGAIRNIGLRLWERFGKTGLLMIGLLGAINIPFYEEMARRIHWWQYSGCRMISFTPWYIILGEFGIALGFALLARTLRRGSWREAVVAGIAGGFSIFVCYALAFWITDRLIS
jgi:hypothetical protein